MLVETAEPHSLLFAEAAALDAAHTALRAHRPIPGPDDDVGLDADDADMDVESDPPTSDDDADGICGADGGGDPLDLGLAA